MLHRLGNAMCSVHVHLVMFLGILSPSRTPIVHQSHYSKKNMDYVIKLSIATTALASLLPNVERITSSVHVEFLELLNFRRRDTCRKSSAFH